MRSLRAVIFSGAVALSFPAYAHGLTPGPRGIYVAFLHTLTEMPAPLMLVALGLLFGLRGAGAVWRAWPPFMLGLIAGLVGVLAWRAYIDPELPLLWITLVAGLWAASGIALPSYGAAAIGLCAGYFMGVFIAPGPAAWSMQGYAIVGGMTAANLGLIGVFSLVAGICSQWGPAWTAIAVRVAASWLAAIAALMIALQMR